MKLRSVLVILFILFLVISISSAGNVHENIITGLPVLGNVNQDGIVNVLDIVKINEIISGKEERNRLADANNDGMIDQKDIDQIQKIIAGKEDIIHYLNEKGEVASVKHPLNKVLHLYENTALMTEIPDGRERMTGIEDPRSRVSRGFPEPIPVPSAGIGKGCTGEKILKIRPDAVFIHTKNGDCCPDLKRTLQENGIDVVHVGNRQSDTAPASLMLMVYILTPHEFQ
jgi:iron complex transport system substrate-binding protein